MRKNKQTSAILLVSFGLIVLVSFLFLPIVNLLFCIILGALCILPFVKNRMILALLFSTLISIIVVTVFAFVLETVFRNHNLFVLLNSLSLLTIAGLGYRLFTQRENLQLRFTRADLIGLVCACASIVVLLIPAFSLDTSSEFIRFLSNGEDNASHFAMYHRIVTTGSLPHFDSEATGLLDGLVIYPQGSHYYMAYVTSAISSAKLPGLLLELRLYYLFTVLLMGGLVGFAVIWIIDRIKKPWDIFGGLVGLLTIMLSLGFFLMGWGFVTQIASYLFLLVGLYALQNFINNRSSFFFVLYIASVIGVASTWYLILPVIGIPALIYLRTLWRHLMKHKKQLILVVVGAIAALAPILINTLLSTKNSPLNEPGGVYKLGWIAWLIIGLGFCACGLIFFFKKKLQFKESSVAIIAWFSSLLITVAIGTYQLTTDGVFAYYFYKTVYTLLLLSIILVAWVLLQTCTKITSNYSRRTVSLVVGSCAVFVIAATILCKPIYPIVYVNNWFNHFLLPDTLHHSTELYSSSTNKNQDVVYIGACVIPLDYLANRWTGAIFLQESIPRSKFEGRIITDQPQQTQKDYLKNYFDSIDPKDTMIITGHCLTNDETELLQQNR